MRIVASSCKPFPSAEGQPQQIGCLFHKAMKNVFCVADVMFKK
jgi:hypothetical protein